MACIALAACSNGRGSLEEPPTEPVTEGPPDPPPTPPPDPPPSPPPDPPPVPPPEPPPDPPPSSTTAALSGYWKGRATDRDSDRSFEAVALIDARGDAQWIVLADDDDDDEEDGVEPFVLYGDVCCAATFDERIAGKTLGETREREGKISVALSNDALTGKLEFRRRKYDLTLAASADYDRNLTMQALQGVYTRTTRSLLGGQSTLTLTIDADGEVTGSHSNGCVFNGSVSIPDGARGMVRLDIELANCGDSLSSSRRWNGSYSGAGALLPNVSSPSDSGSREDVFYHSTVGPTWLGPQSVGR